jgi:hypothetical protein
MDAITSQTSLATLQAMNVKMLQASIEVMKTAEKLTEPAAAAPEAPADLPMGRVIDLSA